MAALIVRAASQFIVHVCDLIEAEGSALRAVIREETGRWHATVSDMIFGLSLLLIAVPVAVGGVGLLAVGLIWALEPRLGAPLAMGVAGIAAVVVAIGVMAALRLQSRRGS